MSISESSKSLSHQVFRFTTITSSQEFLATPRDNFSDCHFSISISPINEPSLVPRSAVFWMLVPVPLGRPQGDTKDTTDPPRRAARAQNLSLVPCLVNCFQQQLQTLTHCEDHTGGGSLGLPNFNQPETTTNSNLQQPRQANYANRWSNSTHNNHTFSSNNSPPPTTRPPTTNHNLIQFALWASSGSATAGAKPPSSPTAVESKPERIISRNSSVVVVVIVAIVLMAVSLTND